MTRTATTTTTTAIEASESTSLLRQPRQKDPTNLHFQSVVDDGTPRQQQCHEKSGEATTSTNEPSNATQTRTKAGLLLWISSAAAFFILGILGLWACVFAPSSDESIVVFQDSIRLNNNNKQYDSIDIAREDWKSNLLAKDVSSRVQTWWEATEQTSRSFGVATLENAERFGQHVKSWWHSTPTATSTTDQSPSGLKGSSGRSVQPSAVQSMEEKRDALEHNFQVWWKGASQAERAWWNTTVNQLRRDKELGGEWVDAAESNFKAKGAALTQQEQSAWESAQRTVHRDDAILASHFAQWWNATKSVSQETVNHATTTETEWWNATEYWFRDHVQQQQQSSSAHAPRRLLYLNSTLAYSLLMNGMHWYDYSADFFSLQGGWDAQINQGYCAIASSAAILNSIPFLVDQNDLLVDPMYVPYHYATQENLLDENNACVQQEVILRNATYDGVLHAPGGLSLEQTSKLLNCIMGISGIATAHHVNPDTLMIEDVRRELEEALKNSSKRVLVNFDRQELGQVGGGHFSPLGSYAKREDAFLLMDVAKYKYPPVWVPTERLYTAMATKDLCGEWDYPNAQVTLRRHEQMPHTIEEYERLVKKIGCKSMYRGFIVVDVSERK